LFRAVLTFCEEIPLPHSSVPKSIIPVIINYHRIFYIHSLSLLARSINSSIKATIIINSAI
ncbi:hypothetical protein, partial [Listeria monocytogenes]|uniref:hypothetical protein n=1 Tax=Listeria monocytogenes TaxID=1639 RepID=UPI001C7CA794